MMARDAQGNNCRLLGTKREEADYITTATPLQTKKKEVENDPQYQDGAINRTREKAVTAARRGEGVRPLDGGIAKK